MIFRVYFEIAGKKLKADVEASSDADAIKKIEGKLRIVRVKQYPELSDKDCEVVEKLMGMMGIFGEVNSNHHG
jgi:hypothetical protein